MEKQILDLLKNMDSKLDILTMDVKDIKKRITKLEEATTDTAEIVTYIKNDVDEIKKDLLQVESITAKNWQDITKLKSIK